MMQLTAKEKLPHFEYETMEITIEPFTNETRIEIEVEDGYSGRPNSRVSMSLEDFDRIALAVSKYRIAQATVAENAEAA